MKTTSQLIGLAAAIALPIASAQSPTSTFTSTIYKTTTVTRSTCSDNVVHCTLGATPFIFSYSYAVAATPTPVAHYHGYDGTATNTATGALGTGGLNPSVPSNGTLHTSGSGSGTITLRVTSTTTLTGTTQTVTLPGLGTAPFSNLTVTSSPIYPTGTGSPITYATLTTETGVPTMVTGTADLASSTTCTETYGFSSGMPMMSGTGAMPMMSSYAPLESSSSSKSYSSTTVILVTSYISYVTPTPTVISEEDVVPLARVVYPSGSSDTGLPGTIGTAAPSVPTATPPPFTNAAATASSGLTLTALAGAIAFCALVFA